MIGTFFWQLEKAREATDEANLRAAYAEVMTSALTEATGSDLPSGVSVSGKVYSKNVDAQQEKNNWSSESSNSVKIGGVDVKADTIATTKAWTVSYDTSTGTATIEEKSASKN